MKKMVFLLFIIVSIILINTNNKDLLIPNEAIRIRVIANSNSIEDQEKKTAIKNEISNYINIKLVKVNNYSEAENVIKNNISNIRNIVNKYETKYTISFGDNYFPEKRYKGTKYNEGLYKSLVITLGEGEGNNFWCVLFPPLCLIDEKNTDKIDYKLYITKLLNNIK